MRIIDEQTAEAYLRQTGRVGPDETVRVHPLAGGVSNMVLLVERDGSSGADFVLKQARAQLRTRQAWFSSIERIWREAEVLAACQRLVEQAPHAAEMPRLPRILFEDRDNYLFAMAAAPRPNATWKEILLAGRAETQIAEACARLLATVHGASWRDPQHARQFDDTTLFDQLRVDPYYRTLAQAQPRAAAAMGALIDLLAGNRRSLVLGDFSPKNLLVYSGGMMLVDFETGHFGDPAFDLGFFLSHLALKACYHAPRHGEFLRLTEAFWGVYRAAMRKRAAAEELAALERRAILNFAGCAWARLDGKSPVDYLNDAARQETMRHICRELFNTPPAVWSQVQALCEQRFGECASRLGATKGC